MIYTCREGDSSISGLPPTSLPLLLCLSFHLRCHSLAPAFQITSLPQNKRLSPPKGGLTFSTKAAEFQDRRVEDGKKKKNAVMPPRSSLIQAKEEKTQVGTKQRNERRSTKSCEGGKKEGVLTSQASLGRGWAGGRGRLSFSHHFWRKRRDTRRRRGEFSPPSDQPQKSRGANK